ncbi:MAG: kelch repeat-containing protein, partial [Terracidiphilus sp.]
MMDGVRYYGRSIAVVVLGLISISAFASGVGRKTQEVAPHTAVSAVPPSPDGQSQTLLPDGRLLLTGGMDSSVAVKAAYFEKASTGARTETSGTLLHARAFHSATLLPSGSVLILGGVGDGSSALAHAELFIPADQTFVDYPTTGLTPRAHHTATLLTDGRVLIAGGIDSQGNTLSQIEVWDYRTGKSTSLAVDLRTPRSGHTATLLADGTVLLSGGQDEHGSPLDYGVIIDPNAPSARFVSRPPEPLKISEPPSLAASIPQSGETGIPIDQLISLRFTEPMDVTSINSSTITLRTSLEKVEVGVVPAEGGSLAFITPQDNLENGVAYTLTISGALDRAGRVMPDMSIIFTTIVATETGTTGGGSGSKGSGSTGSGGVGGDGSVPSGFSSEWRKLPMLRGEEGVTALAGQVLTLDGSPLPNVLIEIDSEHAITDKTGRFLVQNTGSGHHIMIVDGDPASTKANSYGLYRVGVDLKAGMTNSLNYIVWMTALDSAHAVQISSPTTSEVVVTNPNVPGLELHIPAGTVIHDARGRVVTQVGITAVSTTQPPFPIRKGLTFPVYFTIQPGGATFANSENAWSTDSAGRRRGRGATIHYGNYMKAKPGARYQFWNYDPAQRGWYTYGNGRVSSDAKKITPEDGTQIFTFDAASAGTCGANCPPQPPPLPSGGGPGGPGGGPGGPGGPPGPPRKGDPVDLQTGLFVYTKTDLMLGDVIPLALTRTYRQGDTVSRAFGVGMTMDYDIFLSGDDNSDPEGFTYEKLILADGAQIYFTRTSPCAGTNGSCGELGAGYTATSTPGDFYGATLNLGGTDASCPGIPGVRYYCWKLTKKDGTVYQFPATENGGANPRQYALIGMNDRHGNSLIFTRDGNGNLTRVTSPNGRWIQFTYDSSNRITGAQDNIGRTTSYTYDPVSGCLATATDANGGVTTYTYNPSGDMLNITDPKNIMYLQNQYDENDRVYQQTQADGSTYHFVYNLDSNGNVIQTNVTDPRGYISKTIFNSDGYMTSDTEALGQAEQQTVTYNRQQGTGLLLSTTDALHRTTTYSYDAMADVTSVTWLTWTPNAVTTTFAYNPRFYELSDITDPLGNATTISYDDSGNMLEVLDPLGNAATFTYNSAGQPITATDPLGNQTQLIYDSGDLVALIDPLGRTTTRFVDGAGRIAAVTDPLGHATRIVYDPLNEITSSTDSLGNQTGLTYDKNGNLLTVTDANQHATKYAYDNMDRTITRTDPLLSHASAQYDLNGNLNQVTDRKSQVTTIQYDGLNRPIFAGFGLQPGPTYQSTVSYTFDAGNRLAGVTDSVSGGISRSYDLLDRLLSETTPQGSVGYTYDADGRRQTMTVSGQSPVNYSFDNASRLTSITQAAANVSFNYDNDGRRTSLTLPNGIIATYN